MNRHSPRHKILICEDDTGILEAMEAALQAEGFLYSTCKNIDDLKEKVRTEHPSIILLDLWLGGKNGEETLQDIFGEQRELPRIVLMSAHSRLEEIAGKYGVEYLAKPFGLRELVDKIEKFL